MLMQNLTGTSERFYGELSHSQSLTFPFLNYPPKSTLTGKYLSTLWSIEVEGPMNHRFLLANCCNSFAQIPADSFQQRSKWYISLDDISSIYILGCQCNVSLDKFHTDNRTAQTPKNMCKLEKMQCSRERKFKKKDGEKGDNFLIAMYFHSL